MVSPLAHECSLTWKVDMKTIAVAMLALALSANCEAGPFGLEMGTSLQALQSKAKLKAEAPYLYGAVNLPDSHPAFRDYKLVVTPQHGLCKVFAWTPEVLTNVYGSELLSAFDRYFDALSSKYGKANRYDFLRTGSIWSDSKDWMMALTKKERTLAAFWSSEKLRLPDNIASIKLEATASGTERGAIMLGYEFKNGDECLAWIRAQKDSKL